MIRKQEIKSSITIDFDYTILSSYIEVENKNRNISFNNSKVTYNVAISNADAVNELTILGEKLNNITNHSYQFDFDNIMYNQNDVFTYKLNNFRGVNAWGFSSSDFMPLNKIETYEENSTEIIETFSDWIKANCFFAPTDNLKTPKLLNKILSIYHFSLISKILYIASSGNLSYTKENKIKKELNNIKSIFKNVDKLYFKQDSEILKILKLEYNFDISLTQQELELFESDVVSKNFDDQVKIIRKLCVIAIYNEICDESNLNSIDRIDDIFLPNAKNYKIEFAPFYNYNKSQFFVSSRCNSIIGIALNQILKNLTAIYGTEVRKCKNPNCTNTFSTTEKSRKIFCTNCREKGIPNKMRVEKYRKNKNDRN